MILYQDDEIVEVAGEVFALVDKQVANIQAATMFLLAVAFVLSLLYLIIRQLRQPKQTKEDGGTIAQVVSETVGSINESYAKRSQAQADKFMQTLNGISDAFMNIDTSWKQHIQLQQESIRIFTEHSNNSEQRQQAIIALAQNAEVLTTTINEVGIKVNNMNEDFGDLKQQMSQALSILQRLDTRINEPLNLSPDAIDTIRQFVEAAKSLETVLPRITQETPKIEQSEGERQSKSKSYKQSNG